GEAAVATPTVVTGSAAGLELVQVDVVVMSSLVPSEKLPVARHSQRTPCGRAAFGGATAIEISRRPETFTVAVPLTLSWDAVMVAWPPPVPWTRPRSTV